MTDPYWLPMLPICHHTCEWQKTTLTNQNKRKK